jgi:hypothetical protein
MKFMRILFALLLTFSACAEAGVFFGNGIRTGEGDALLAMVWLRLTDAPEHRMEGTPFRHDDPKNPDGLRLSDMKDSLMGKARSLQLRYTTKDGEMTSTPWCETDPQREFTATTVKHFFDGESVQSVGMPTPSVPTLKAFVRT